MKVKSFFLGTLLWLSMGGVVLAQTQSQLPPGMEQFVDGNGAPYAGGKLFFYQPFTSTPKATFKDPNAQVQNTNPLVLDANGRGIVWGSGLYRQVLQDSLGNLVWDQLSSSPSQGSASGSTICSNSSTTGSSNAQILSPPSTLSSLSIGTIYCAVAGFSNSGPMTLEVGALGFEPVLKQSSGGLTALQGGEVQVGQGYQWLWDGTEFQLLNATTTSLGLFIDPTQSPYGCKGDGTTDDTVCMQGVLGVAASSNVPVWLGPHLYKINNLGLSPSSAVVILGTNAMWPHVCVSGFKAASANATLLTLPEGSRVENACLEMNATGVNSSGTAIVSHAGTTRLYGLYIDGACIGVDIAGNSSSIDHGYFGNVGGGGNCYGMVIGATTTAAATVDLRVTNTTIQGNVANPPGANQLIEDAGGLFEVNNDMLYGTIGTLIQPGANQQVTWGFFDNTVLGDTNPQQSLVISVISANSVIQGLNFSNSWSASSALGDAVVIKNTGGGTLDGVNFVGHRIINASTGNGLNILAGTDISYVGGAICGISTGQNGVVISSVASRVKINDNTIGKNCLGLGVFNSATGTTGVASLATSTASKVMAVGNDFSTSDTGTSGTFTVNTNNM